MSARHPPAKQWGRSPDVIRHILHLPAITYICKSYTEASTRLPLIRMIFQQRAVLFGTTPWHIQPRPVRQMQW